VSTLGVAVHMQTGMSGGPVEDLPMRTVFTVLEARSVAVMTDLKAVPPHGCRRVHPVGLLEGGIHRHHLILPVDDQEGALVAVHQ